MRPCLRSARRARGGEPPRAPRGPRSSGRRTSRLGVPGHRLGEPGARRILESGRGRAPLCARRFTLVSQAFTMVSGRNRDARGVLHGFTTLSKVLLHFNPDGVWKGGGGLPSGAVLALRALVVIRSHSPRPRAPSLPIHASHQGVATPNSQALPGRAPPSCGRVPGVPGPQPCTQQLLPLSWRPRRGASGRKLPVTARRRLPPRPRRGSRSALINKCTYQLGGNDVVFALRAARARGGGT